MDASDDESYAPDALRFFPMRISSLTWYVCVMLGANKLPDASELTDDCESRRPNDFASESESVDAPSSFGFLSFFAFFAFFGLDGRVGNVDHLRPALSTLIARRIRSLDISAFG